MTTYGESFLYMAVLAIALWIGSVVMIKATWWVGDDDAGKPGGITIAFFLLMAVSVLMGAAALYLTGRLTFLALFGGG